MATAMESGENSRISDLCDEPIDRLLAPIRGYENKPLVPLTETIQPISGFFNDIQDYVYVALHNCQNPTDNLSQEESASIHLYTMQFHDGPSLFLLLNQSLRAENREQLKPWFSFLKLFLTALYKLPPQNERVWRGVKNVDLSSKYKTGTKFAWWGVSSCTTNIQVLESNTFLGKHGERTLFSIDCINGKSIASHSYFKNTEKEIILMPGSYFEVIGQVNPAPQLHIIQLKEILPPILLVKPPFSTSSENNSSSVINKSNTFSQPTSNMINQNKSSNIFPHEMPIKSTTKWKQVAVIVAGGNGQGTKLNQLSFPNGIFIDYDQTIYIIDWGNDRLVQWKSNERNGQIIVGENEAGNEINQLDHPIDVIFDQENNSFIISDRGNRRVMRWSSQNNTKHAEIIISDIDCRGLTMDKNGSLYVSDYKKNEVKRWKRGETYGTIIAGAIEKEDQLNGPTFIFIDEDYSLYVSDQNNHRVMKWMKDAKEGIVVAGGNGKGNNVTQLYHPEGVVVDHLGQIYVADSSNDRVMRWRKGAKEGTIIVGGNGEGEQSNQLNYPRGLSFDQQGNLYVVDSSNHRVQKFEIDKN